MSVKNLVEGEREYTSVKEILWWILDMEAGTVTLPERNIEEFLNLVEIPATQHRMGQKYLERLVEKSDLCTLRCQGQWAASSTSNAR